MNYNFCKEKVFCKKMKEFGGAAELFAAFY
jgi:hypothetical protein